MLKELTHISVCRVPLHVLNGIILICRSDRPVGSSEEKDACTVFSHVRIYQFKAD